MRRLAFGDTVTRRRKGATDIHGDPIGGPSTVTLSNWGLDWNATFSNKQFQDVQVTDVDGYAPRGDDVQAGDEIIATRDGKSITLAVQGIPMWDQVHPLSGKDFGHKLIRMRAVSGA